MNFQQVSFLRFAGITVAENGRTTFSSVAHTLLYHLYQLHAKKKWSKIFQKWSTILENLPICESKAKAWLNSEDAKLFLDLKHIPGRANEIVVKSWVLEAYAFFEKTGMMKWFRDDPEKWRKTFFKRFDKILTPLLDLGLNLKQIYERLMNKLSTKTEPKRDGLESQKGTTSQGTYIKSPCSIKPNGHLDRNREIPSFLKPFLEVKEFLSDRLQMQEGDINFFLRSYSINQTKEAVRKASAWLRNGLIPQSPVMVFQKLLSKRG